MVYLGARTALLVSRRVELRSFGRAGLRIGEEAVGDLRVITDSSFIECIACIDECWSTVIDLDVR